MKKLLMFVVAVCFACSTAALAQDMGKSCDMGKAKDKTAAAAPLKTLKGTVKAEGDKVTFVSDADQKSWDVMNPETLKGHEGHHVAVTGQVTGDSVHVESVKMMKASSM